MSETTPLTPDEFFALFKGHPLANLANMTAEELAAATEDFPELIEGEEIIGQLTPFEIRLLALREDLRRRINELATEYNQTEDPATIAKAFHQTKTQYEMVDSLFWASVRDHPNVSEEPTIGLRRGGEVVKVQEHHHFRIILGPFDHLFDSLLGHICGHGLQPSEENCAICPTRDDCPDRV